MKPSPHPWRVEPIEDAGMHGGPVWQILATINGYPSTVAHIEEYSEVPGATIDRALDAQRIAASPLVRLALGARAAADIELAPWLEAALSEASIAQEFKEAIVVWLAAHDGGTDDLALARGPLSDNNQESQET